MKKLILSLLIFCSAFVSAQISIPQVTGLPAALNSKVDKVAGKSLVADTLSAKIQPTATAVATKEPLLPSTPSSPESRFLNGNKQWSEIVLGSGGYASNVYFTNLASTIVGTYKQTSGTHELTETIASGTCNNNEVLIYTYLFEQPVGITTVDAGVWRFTMNSKINSNVGDSKFKIVQFKRSSTGVETDMFTIYSNTIENTDYQNFIIETVQPSFSVDPLDRFGCRIYATTTTTVNKTISYKVGDGNASYLNTPLALRHSQLRDKNGESTYQHLTSAQVTKVNNTSGINTGDETLTSIKTKLGAATAVSDGYLKYQDWVRFDGKMSSQFPDVVKESGDSYYRAQSGMKVMYFGTDNYGGFISNNDSVFIGFRDSKSTFYKPVVIQTQNASDLALSVHGKVTVSDTLSANTLVGNGSKITNITIDSTNIHTSLKAYTNLLDAKNINYVSLGNSITKGVGSTGDSIGYAYLINKKVGFKSFTNLGIPGARCKPTVGHYELYDEVSVIPTNANLITVMIGINDVTDGGVIGNVAEVIGKTFVSLDRTLSFSEAYRFNMETIKRNFPNAKIFALTPTQTIYNGGISQKKYVDAIIAIANYLSIPVIDTYNSSGIWKEGSMIPDGIHPNNDGHKTIADYVLKKIVEGGGSLIANSVSPFFTDGSSISLGTPYQFSTLTVSKPSSDDSGVSPTGSLLISAVGDASAGLSMGVSGTSTSTYLQSRSIYNANKYSLSLNPNGGNVGIGYATDAGYALGKLSVNGTGYFNGNVTATSFIGSGSNLTGVQLPITLTTNGTSGAATFSGNVLNVPNYTASGGVNQTQTTVNGSVNGNAICSMPFQTPTYKKVIILLGSFSGSLTYTFPTPFLFAPNIYTGAPGISPVTYSVTTTGLTLSGGSNTNGWVTLEGF